MARINSLKTYFEGGYYHIYNRGVKKMAIFQSDQDKEKFLRLIGRYLSSTEVKNQKGKVYKSYYNDITVNAYCIMDNHFHLVIKCVKNPENVVKFMHALLTSFSKYYNDKYQSVGYNFQGVYRSAPMEQVQHFNVISRYIHLNPGIANYRYKNYKYSSYKQFLGGSIFEWFDAENLKLGMNSSQYEKYCDTVEPSDLVLDYELM